MSANMRRQAVQPVDADDDAEQRGEHQRVAREARRLSSATLRHDGAPQPP